MQFSPSQIKLFMQEPALWVIRKLSRYDKRFISPQNGYAIRGTVFGEALEQAMMSGDFNRAAWIKDEIITRCEAAGCSIPSLSSIDDDWEAAKDRLHDKRPISVQRSFSHPVPYGVLTGYIDLEYAERCADIKYRSGQDYDVEDRVQMSCYWAATGKEQWVFKIAKGKVKMEFFSEDEMALYWNICLQNMAVMSGYEEPKSAEIAKKIIRQMPINNPAGWWFPAAWDLVKEAHGW